MQFRNVGASPPADEQCVIASTERLIVAALSSRAAAIFVREPFFDARYPRTSDADVLAFADGDVLVPERMNLPPAEGTLPVDVIWLPRPLLAAAPALAGQGLVLHRLATSRLLHDADGMAARQQAAVLAAMREPGAQAARVEGFFEMGFLAVREIGVTWDLPSFALFWLHMAAAATLAAGADALGLFCPNVYTRPFDALRDVEAATGWRWRDRLVGALRLDADPEEAAIARLPALRDTVARRFPVPDWPPAMRETTRAEYGYFRDADELAWRIAVAREMTAAGDTAAAMHYLRFWAYCLARVPMVWEAAAAGRHVSFMRPERAVGPALRRICPEIIAPVDAILAGDGIGRADVEAALAVVMALRADVLALLHDRGVRLADPKPWAPYRANADAA